MLAFKTEGIILKRKDFGEADRILTIFSASSGKISVLAKGVRRITSRRAGNVELLNRVQMYLHPGKNFLILTEAISIDTYQKLKENLTLSTYGYHLLELVDKLTAENQENRTLYQHLLEVLKRLEKNPRQILIRAFEVKILSNLGFLTFQTSTPGVSAQFHTRSVHSNIKNLIQSIEILPWDEIEKIKIDQKQALELERILRYHVEKVLETSLKSRQFLKKVR